MPPAKKTPAFYWMGYTGAVTRLLVDGKGRVGEISETLWGSYIFK